MKGPTPMPTDRFGRDIAIGDAVLIPYVAEDMHGTEDVLADAHVVGYLDGEWIEVTLDGTPYKSAARGFHMVRSEGTDTDG